MSMTHGGGSNGSLYYYNTGTSCYATPTTYSTVGTNYVVTALQPPEPARRKTELDWLDEQVDKVCALAR